MPSKAGQEGSNRSYTRATSRNSVYIMAMNKEEVEYYNGNTDLSVGAKVKTSPNIQIKYPSGWNVEAGTEGKVIRIVERGDGLKSFEVKTKDGCRFACPGVSLILLRAASQPPVMKAH